MKLLFVYDIKQNDNPYVSTLKRALIADGMDVVCSDSDFWNNFQNYDIIHLQWPEFLRSPSYKGDELSQEEYLKIVEHVNLVKSQCKIVVTCHNLKPHNSANKYRNLLCEYVYCHCDVMIHLGPYSLEYFEKIIPSTTKHWIIPHHVYDDLYQFSLSKTIARKQLGIPQSANVLLCFGAFRNDEEREMVIKAWSQVRLPNKFLLAPGFFRRRRNIILGYKAFFKSMFYKMNRIHFTNKFLSDNEVETYLCAADVLMIQRCRILNSGNLPLGFWAKKIVVGPDLGNVGVILRRTGNPVFDPNNILSIATAIQKGFSLKDGNLQKKNYQFAFENWRTSTVSNQLHQLYREILELS